MSNTTTTTNATDAAPSGCGWFSSCKSNTNVQTVESDAKIAIAALESRLQALELAFTNGTVQADVELILADGQKIASVLSLFVPELLSILTNNPAVLTDFSNFMTVVDSILSKATSSFGVLNTMIVALLNIPTAVATTATTATTATATKSLNRSVVTAPRSTISKVTNILSINCPQITKLITSDTSSVPGFVHFLSTIDHVIVKSGSSLNEPNGASNLFASMTKAISPSTSI